MCFLDITASNENRNIILDTVKKTAEKCFIPLNCRRWSDELWMI